MKKIFFTLNSASDLLNKCIFEFSEISNTIYSNHVIYQIFNLTLSLNHLFEWFLADDSNSKDLKIVCLKNFYPYEKKSNRTECKTKLNNKAKNNSINFLISKMQLDGYVFEVNEKQRFIREISNHIKHINYKIDTTVNKSYINQCGEDVCCGEGHYSGDYDKYIFFVKDKNQEVDLLKLIEDLLNEWKYFFINALT